MSFIELFGTKIKPKLTYGKKMWRPIPTGKRTEVFFFVRDRDVNCFLLRAKRGYIAIDSGCKNSEWMREGLKHLNIDPHQVHNDPYAIYKEVQTWTGF